MSSIQTYAPRAGTLQLPVVWHDSDLADAVFLIVQDGDLGLVDREQMRERIADIWRGNLQQKDAWNTLLIMAPRMAYPMPCTVERDPKAVEHTAVFRTADGVAQYAMKI